MAYADASDGVRLWYERVGSGTPIVFVHEFGGKYHPARPFMRPALNQMADQFPEQFGGLDFTGSGK